MSEFPLHPLAIPGNCSGALGMQSGDRVYCTLSRRYCIVDEFLPDGDALITLLDGSHLTVKWNHLQPLA